MTNISQYLQAFELFEQNGFRKDPSWLRLIRKEAIKTFEGLGFPTMRHEHWRYTNVTPITETQFQLVGKPVEITLNEIRPFLFGREDWPRLVFINGIFYETLSSLIGTGPKGKGDLSLAKNGITIGNLAVGIEGKIVSDHLSRYADSKQNAFTALNTAFFHDGAFIHFSKDAISAEPIHLLFISTSAEPKILLSSVRNLIVLDANSKASVIENYVVLGGVTGSARLKPGTASNASSYFNNPVTEIVLNQGAQLEHHKILRESQNAFHIGTVHVNGKESSRFFSSVIEMEGGLIRNNLNVILNGEGSECDLNGLYLTGGREHVDNHTLIDHPKPRGTSRQVYKGILSGKSTGVFSGKIFVHQDAQKTDASQTNKNLLLSKDATVDTKPQLEIFADDVKCTHGAAVGQLEDEAIFYLKTRGIDEQAASKLLSYGFASEVIDRIQIEPVKVELNQILQQKLESFL